QKEETDEVPSILACLRKLRNLKSLSTLKISLSPWYQTNFQVLDREQEFPILTQIHEVHFKMILDPHQLQPLEGCFPNATEIRLEILENYVRDLDLFDEFCDQCLPVLVNDLTKQKVEQVGRSICFRIK